VASTKFKDVLLDSGDTLLTPKAARSGPARLCYEFSDQVIAPLEQTRLKAALVPRNAFP